MKNKRISLRQALGMWLLGAPSVGEPPNQKSVTAGQILPRWQDGRPMWSEWSTDKAIRDGFKASTWVYACVYRIMKAAASIPWEVSKQVRPGEWEVVPNHPLQLLLEQPNPYMSGQDLMERLTAHLYLGGNGLLTKVRAGGVVAELWPIGPEGIKPVPSRADFIKQYEYQQGGRQAHHQTGGYRPCDVCRPGEPVGRWTRTLKPSSGIKWPCKIGPSRMGYLVLRNP